MKQTFKFYAKLDDTIYTAVLDDNHKYVITWDDQDLAYPASYDVNEVDGYIKTGAWVVIEEEFDILSIMKSCRRVRHRNGYIGIVVQHGDKLIIIYKHGYNNINNNVVGEELEYDIMAVYEADVAHRVMRMTLEDDEVPIWTYDADKNNVIKQEIKELESRLVELKTRLGQ